MNKNANVQVIAVAGGKGGIGKTNISSNLAIALSKQQQKVMLLDADFGLSNIPILLNLSVNKNLQDVLESKCLLKDIIIKKTENLSVISAGRGEEKISNLHMQDIYSLINMFSNLDNNPNYLIIDTAAGVSESVVGISQAANEIIVVACDDPMSISDAYVFVKIMNKQYGKKKFKFICNKVKSESEAKQVYTRLLNVTDKYLNVSFEYLGYVPFDLALQNSVKSQVSVVNEFPNSPSARAFKAIANKILFWPKPVNLSEGVSFFYV